MTGSAKNIDSMIAWVRLKGDLLDVRAMIDIPAGIVQMSNMANVFYQPLYVTVYKVIHLETVSIERLLL
ncbi:hypothetical protein [Bacillus cabrialesii]|uniref:Uncharacterized protein n=1 Tax=Bacillus cabrialesii subsp. tritici TaxID=2944916 RepID=A0ABT9DK62_9BACI|nr:hypothetical protein [Bacillus cabrialesii]MDO8225077.1 hypothetical protein [Bacillus cabrialesii subsp. tritici]MDU0153600.1 hypothetical protein [Bacillus cabrialesii]